MESETENVRHLSKVIQCVQNPGQVVGFSGGTKVRLAIPTSCVLSPSTYLGKSRHALGSLLEWKLEGCIGGC